MAAQMKLALPPISKILVKLCLFAHILLVSLAYLGFAPGVLSFVKSLGSEISGDNFWLLQGFYLYLNLIFFVLLLLHLHVPSHPETVHLALATNLVCIIHNVITITIVIIR